MSRRPPFCDLPIASRIAGQRSRISMGTIEQKSILQPIPECKAGGKSKYGISSEEWCWAGGDSGNGVQSSTHAPVDWHVVKHRFLWSVRCLIRRGIVDRSRDGAAERIQGLMASHNPNRRM